jgi:dCMP deaminase
MTEENFHCLPDSVVNAPVIERSPTYIADWDEYFMRMVYLASYKSKDNRTNIGAVVVGKEHEILSTGYNSFPRGLNDSVPARFIRPEKYFWFEHAERNAVYNACRSGVSLVGATMYTQAIPCCDCCRGVIQSGIKELVLHTQAVNTFGDKWYEQGLRSLEMCKECGVEIRYFDKVLGMDYLRDGKILKV